jgi:hypothetical protein
MKATALFPDGFCTDQTSNRQTVQSSLRGRSFSKIHFLAFVSGYPTPSAVCHCPILVRKPSGLAFPFKFKASIIGGEKGISAEEDASSAIAGSPSVSSYKTHGCLGNREPGPRLQLRAD